MSDWRDRISVDPKIYHGKPCIRGTRIAVSTIVNSLADGDSNEVLLRAYPALTQEDIRAALMFAAEAIQDLDWLPVPR